MYIKEFCHIVWQIKLGVLPLFYKTMYMTKLTIVLFIAMCGSIAGIAQNATNKNTTMKVAVWDTYVKKKDGSVMHFDIIAPESVKDTTVIYRYGKDYLATKGQAGQPLSSKECRFCHIASLRPHWEADIHEKGYFILEMENCN